MHGNRQDPLTRMYAVWDDMRARNGYGRAQRTKQGDKALLKLHTTFVATNIASPEFLTRYFEQSRILCNSKAKFGAHASNASLFYETLWEDHYAGLEVGSEYLRRSGEGPDQSFTAYNLSLLDDFIKMLLKTAKRVGSLLPFLSTPSSESNPAWLRLCAARFLAEIGSISLAEAEEAAEVYGQDAWEYYRFDPSIRKIFDSWLFSAEQCFGEYVEKPIPTPTKQEEQVYADKLGRRNDPISESSANLIAGPIAMDLPPPPMSKKNRP